MLLPTILSPACRLEPITTDLPSISFATSHSFLLMHVPTALVGLRRTYLRRADSHRVRTDRRPKPVRSGLPREGTGTRYDQPAVSVCCGSATLRDTGPRISHRQFDRYGVPESMSTVECGSDRETAA